MGKVVLNPTFSCSKVALVHVCVCVGMGVGMGGGGGVCICVCPAEAMHSDRHFVALMATSLAVDGGQEQGFTTWR